MRKMVKGLLTDNFRSWGPTQFRQYASLFGHSKRCGIEIEFKPSVRTQVLCSPWVYTRALLTSDGITKFNEAEVTRLYDVTNPISFVKELKQSWSELAEAQVDMTGSLHINHQGHANFRWRPDYMSILPDGIFPKDRGYVRFENKYGQMSYLWEDIIVQMLWSKYNWALITLRRSGKIDEREMMSRAYQFWYFIVSEYPKERRLLSILNFNSPKDCAILKFRI